MPSSEPLGKPDRVSDFRFTYPVEVRFADLDLLGHVNHVAFIEMLEQARVNYYYRVLELRSVREIQFVLADLRLRYAAPALFGQTVLVGVRVTWLRRSSSGFAFEIRDQASGALLVEGEGVQVYVDLETGQGEPLPAAYRQRIQAFEAVDLTPL